LAHLLRQEFHITQLDLLSGLQPVERQAFPSGVEYSLTQGKEFNLFSDGKLLTVPQEQVNRRSIQKNGDIVPLIQQKIAKPDGIPFNLRISTG
jgi:hypothetical protein